MVSYAIDIENPRVQLAMNELGILKEELVIKPIKDFADPHISKEIQQLRFDHYMKFLKSSINDIRDIIKTNNINKSAKDISNLIPNYQQSSITQRPNNLQNSKYPIKHRALLQNTLSVFELPLNTSQKLLKPSESYHSLHSNSPLHPSTKKNLKKFKELQSQNYKALQISQIKSQNDLQNFTKKQMKDHIEREQSLEDLKKLKLKQKDESFQRKYEEIQSRKLKNEQGQEEDIIVKLQNFETKIKKSEKIHEEALKAKIERSLKLREIAGIVQKNIVERKKSHELEVFQRLVEKHENVKSHRDRIEEQIQRVIVEKKERFEKQRIEAVGKIKKAEEDYVQKSRSMEKMYLNAQNAVNERKIRIQHEMILRRELKKIKDMECSIKIQRAKRRFDAKNTKSLKKTLSKYQKIEDFKQEREKIIYHNRESAIKAMVEREKFQEAVALICKSPRSKTAQLKLKSLNYPIKEVLLQDSNLK